MRNKVLPLIVISIISMTTTGYAESSIQKNINVQTFDINALQISGTFTPRLNFQETIQGNTQNYLIKNIQLSGIKKGKRDITYGSDGPSWKSSTAINQETTQNINKKKTDSSIDTSQKTNTSGSRRTGTVYYSFAKTLPKESIPIPQITPPKKTIQTITTTQNKKETIQNTPPLEEKIIKKTTEDPTTLKEKKLIPTSTSQNNQKPTPSLNIKDTNIKDPPETFINTKEEIKNTNTDEAQVFHGTAEEEKTSSFPLPHKSIVIIILTATALISVKTINITLLGQQLLTKQILIKKYIHSIIQFIKTFFK
jgi:hypothetical protein